jgi:NAD-dependent SIR2 family protein deacetylase
MTTTAATTMTTDDDSVLDVISAHGLMGDKSWELPQLVTRSAEATRADQGNFTHAHEFLDAPAVLASKISAVARLLRQSAFAVAYCGAGLSKAAGIADYATNPGNTILRELGAAAKRGAQNPFEAQPTFAHRVLARMVQAGLVKELVQQNHDGLPQKAGVPHEKVNEIHGALFDPANPVVQFNGHLRADLFEWMIATEKKADLCLCLGTSLSGMNADRIAEKPAQLYWGAKRGLGTVIVNLQRTRLDSKSSIRIWAKLDDTFGLLAQELGLGEIGSIDVGLPLGDVYDVPYNAEGVLDPAVRMRLNLHEESELRIAPPGAVNVGKTGKIQGKSPEGDYLIGFTKLRPSILGRWMVDAAIRGALPVLPVVNVHPVIWRHGVDPVPAPPAALPPITGTLILA